MAFPVHVSSVNGFSPDGDKTAAALQSPDGQLSPGDALVALAQVEGKNPVRMDNIELDPESMPPDACVGIGSYKLKHEPKPEVVKAPEQAIPELFEKMPFQKQALLAIIDFCREERYADDVDEVLVEYLRNRRSVYSPVVMRDLLLRAGALAYVESDEEQQLSEEDFLDEDGNLVVIEVPEGTWRATEEGVAYLEAQNPIGETMAAIKAHAKYRDVYRRILGLCAEQPRTAPELDKLVGDEPALQDPPRIPGYLIGHLEDAGALYWNGKWSVSETGKAVLAQLEGGQR